MRVVLILSLATVLLTSVAFAAPSRDALPAYDSEDIKKRGMEIFESFMDWKRSLPADSDGSFHAFQSSLQQREPTADQKGGPETPLTENQQRESLAEEQVSDPDLQKIARDKRGMEIFESFMDWKRSLPADSDGSFHAFQSSLQQRELSADQEGGPETPLTENQQRESLAEEQVSDADQQKIARASKKIKPDKLTKQYQQWLKKVAQDFELTNDEFESLYRIWRSKNSAGKDLSYRAFVRWMQENYVLEVDEDGYPRKIPYIRWGWKIGEWYKNIYANEKIDNNERLMSEGQQFPNEEQQAIDGREAAAASKKINPDILTKLYQQWLKKVTKGRDSSFKAFLDWFEDQDDDDDEPDDADDFGLTNDEFESLYRIWRSKNSTGEDLSYRAFVRWMQENYALEVDEDGNPRKATYIRWGWKIGDWFKNRYANEKNASNERQLAEAQQFPNEEQPAINGREAAAAYDYGGLAGENVDREWQEPIAADMERRQGEEREGFAPVQFARAASQEGSSPTPVEAAAPQEEQTALPFVEQESNDTNGGYSCEENNPCNIENIVNTQYYFATASTDKYIHCDGWGGCHTLTCDDGLAWDDQIKKCGLRT